MASHFELEGKPMETERKAWSEFPNEGNSTVKLKRFNVNRPLFSVHSDLNVPLRFA